MKGLRTSKKKKKKIRKISKNKNYIRGRQWEYYVKKHYEKLGYYVKRSYASKGAEDLCAMKYNPLYKQSEILHIQCKNLKVEKKLSKLEKDNLLALCRITGGKALHIFNRNHKLVIEEL